MATAVGRAGGWVGVWLGAELGLVLGCPAAGWLAGSRDGSWERPPEGLGGPGDGVGVGDEDGPGELDPVDAGCEGLGRTAPGPGLACGVSGSGAGAPITVWANCWTGSGRFPVYAAATPPDSATATTTAEPPAPSRRALIELGFRPGPEGRPAPAPTVSRKAVR